MSTVLVTGGSGFVGSHVIIECLKAGHTVRTTVRDLKRKPDVLEMLKVAGIEPSDQLSFFAADLAKDEGWTDAVKGCDFVLHVASPFPSSKVQHEDDWSRIESPLEPYIKSKTIAEKAAWEFIKTEGRGLELTTLNPTGIFGPALSRDLSASFAIIQILMTGALPFCPKIYFGIVDVRDVAELHLKAMIYPEASGQRFLITNGPTYSMHDVAMMLKKRMGPVAKKVPKFEIPNFVLRLLALFNTKARKLLPNLGIIRRGSSEKSPTNLELDTSFN